jgi:alginate O-acetyltransferase complex protein AlgI
MLLHTSVYLVFLGIIVGIYWLLPVKLRKPVLLIASYVFYASFDIRYAVLLAAWTGVIHVIVHRISGSVYARRWLVLGILLNLGLLGIFKYLGFLTGFLKSGLALFGLRTHGIELELLLPIGISFYTFQAISYLIEVYKGTQIPYRLLDLAIYIAFFPRLVAGPLLTPGEFSRQTANLPKKLPNGDVLIAFRLLLLGLIKKVVIADGLASLGEAAFRAASLPSTTSIFPAPLYWQGFYLYAFQIYADFSGYTDLARASAMFFGISLPENFQQPYFAHSLAVFWNSWHMTLTRWFREYFFFPLSRLWMKSGGRNYPRLVQVSSNIITMILIGLWHGASWTFVVWGAWHALLLSIERLFNPVLNTRWKQVVGSFITFHIVGIGWVLFRADSFSAALRFYHGLILGGQWHWIGNYMPPVLVAGTLVFGIDYFSKKRHEDKKWLANINPVLVTAAIVILSTLGFLSWLNEGAGKPFIYGQF